MRSLVHASDADIRRLIGARGHAAGEPDWTLVRSEDDGLVEYRAGGRLHRRSGPARQRWERLEYHVDGALHRDDGPAVIDRHGEIQEWWVRGRRHRTNEPAVVHDSPFARREEYWVDGRRHRDGDLPAVTCEDVSEWWTHGRLQRTAGPARVNTRTGLSEYFQGGVRHRMDDPAVCGDPHAATEYWVAGVRHRDADQPALITPQGSRHYLKHGVRHRPVELGPAVVHPDPHPTAYAQPADMYWEHGICLLRDPQTGAWAPHEQMMSDDHRRRAGLPVHLHLDGSGAPDANVCPGIALWVAWDLYTDDEPGSDRMVYWTDFDGVDERARSMRLDEHGDACPRTLERLRELPAVRVEAEACSVRLTARPAGIKVHMDLASSYPLSLNHVTEIHR